jgi:hypothetical protein
MKDELRLELYPFLKVGDKVYFDNKESVICEICDCNSVELKVKTKIKFMKKVVHQKNLLKRFQQFLEKNFDRRIMYFYKKVQASEIQLPELHNLNKI